MKVFFLVRERLEEMSELVCENVKGAQKCQKRWYDQNAGESVLESGEEVSVLLPLVATNCWLSGKVYIACCVG